MLTFSISTQWKTMLVFIHANGLCGINMLFEINKCPGSLGVIKVRQTFKVHWEERKGKELQPHNCAQVFPLIFCSCKLPELKVHWNFEIDINLLKYQSKDMLFWPLLWTHSFKSIYSGGGSPPVVTVYSKCMKVNAPRSNKGKQYKVSLYIFLVWYQPFLGDSRWTPWA